MICIIFIGQQFSSLYIYLSLSLVAVCITYRCHHVQSQDFLFYLGVLVFQIPYQYNFPVGGIDIHLHNSTHIQVPYNFSNAALAVCYVTSPSAVNSLLASQDRSCTFYQDHHQLNTCLVCADHLYDFSSPIMNLHSIIYLAYMQVFDSHLGNTFLRVALLKDISIYFKFFHIFSMYRVQYRVRCLNFYKHVFISIVRTIFTGDPVQFGLLGVDINLGINQLHTYGPKTDCKDCKASLKGEKRPHMCFYGQGIDKPYSLRSVIKVSRLSCQVSIEYWSIQTAFSLYISIFACCEFGDVALEILSRLSFKATQISRLTRFWYLNHYQNLLLCDQNRAQRNGDLVR